jgi:hypothetical protein
MVAVRQRGRDLPGVPDQAPWDAPASAQQPASAPRDPTIQLYGDEQPEASRALGQSSTELTLAASFPNAAGQP